MERLHFNTVPITDSTQSKQSQLDQLSFQEALENLMGEFNKGKGKEKEKEEPVQPSSLLPRMSLATQIKLMPVLKVVNVA